MNVGENLERYLLTQSDVPWERFCLICGDKEKLEAEHINSGGDGSAGRRFNLLLLPCGHHYCRECLARLFNSSLTDDSLFPPSCCQRQIPVSPVAADMTPDFLASFELRQLEYAEQLANAGIIGGDRIYCRGCARFIPAAAHVDSVAMCPRCKVNTCTLCKELSHHGPCLLDQERVTVEEVARLEKWAQCPSCKHFVEKVEGCGHVTCRCRTEFCYMCSKTLDDCQCEFDDELDLDDDDDDDDDEVEAADENDDEEEEEEEDEMDEEDDEEDDDEGEGGREMED